MLQNLVLMFKNKEIRNRILFTLGILFVYRLGCAIPLPGINKEALLAGIDGNNIINLMNLLGGGALDQFSVLSLGVGPYITASIITVCLRSRRVSVMRLDWSIPHKRIAAGRGYVNDKSQR